MATHETFAFRTLEELKAKTESLGITIPISNDWSSLARQVKVGNLLAPNAMAVLPMEGCDSQVDGSPTELVERRYQRFAAGGAGLLWWEACAVVPEGKANPQQMMLTNNNLGEFERLITTSNQAAQNANGSDHCPIHILQLTHSGRYSRPKDHKLEPLTVQRDPILDPRSGLTSESPVLSDAYLENLVEKYVHSAKLAKEAGFDGVDIKACHRYLLSELLGAHLRNGKYGGKFENRIRLLLDIVKETRNAVGRDFIIASRINVFDAHPYPYGFGCDQNDMWKFHPAEPIELVRLLCKNGVGLLNNSAGNPYYIYPQVTRPFDRSSIGIPVPNEHPLESIARLFEFTHQIQVAAGCIPVVGSGYSWLRQFIPYVGAANLTNGRCSFIGMGRSSLAYPDAPREILAGKGMDPGKCCVTCSKCTQIMRDHGRTGCVVRDSKIYDLLYREAYADAMQRNASVTNE